MYRFMPTTHSVIAAFLMLPFMANPAMADGKPETRPMALKAIMVNLGRDMQAITEAISKEDWESVANISPRIAKHDSPPMSEKVRLLSWLGANAGKFRAYDEVVHESATEMGKAAKQNDGQAVIEAFSKLQQGCLACHQNYRKPFIEKFYKP